MLQKAITKLISRTITIFLDRRGELDFEDYPSYFAGMGELIAKIEQYTSLGAIVSDLEKGEFEVIGYFMDDSDMLSEFFDDIKR